MTAFQFRTLTASVLTAALVHAGVSAQAPAQSVPDFSGVYLVRDFRGDLSAMSLEFRGKGAPQHPEEARRFSEFVTMRDKLPPEEDPSPSARCLPPGLTFIMTAPYPFEIVQTATKILTFHEFGNFVRQIRLNWRNGRGLRWRLRV